MAAAGLVPQAPASPPVTHPSSTATSPELSEKLSDAYTPPAASPPRRLSISPSFESNLTSSTAPSHLCVGPRAPTAAVFRTLIFLTFINPFLSLAAALYTVPVLVLCLFTGPLHPAATIHSRLLPVLQLHVRFLSEDPEREPEVTAAETSPGRLVAMNLATPVLSIPVALASAAVTLVWFYTEVLLGDESQGGGIEYRSFLTVRGWWERLVFWPTVGMVPMEPSAGPGMQQV